MRIQAGRARTFQDRLAVGQPTLAAVVIVIAGRFVAIDVITGEQKKASGGPPAFQNVFGETLAKLADNDERICAITAAMPSGTVVTSRVGGR